MQKNPTELNSFTNTPFPHPCMSAASQLANCVCIAPFGLPCTAALVPPVLYSRCVDAPLTAFLLVVMFPLAGLGPRVLSWGAER